MERCVRTKAYAKINLGLVVKGKRADGYHELEMVTVPVDLFDMLYIEKSAELKITTNKWYLPTNEKNTLYKTLQAMHQRYNIDMNYAIHLVKNIPTQAGMGGGSSDSATLINVLDEQLKLKMSLQDKIDLGLQVGADVPYCIMNVPSIVSGIGEIIQPIQITCPFYIFLAKPKFGISTPLLFKELVIHENSKVQLDLLVKGLTTNRYDLVVDNLVNDLYHQALLIHPELKGMVQEFIDFGFDAACMTGSGSTIFAITQDEQLIRKAVEAFHFKYELVKKSQIVGLSL